jgi:8-oxo-dGTP diphosphatase
MMAEMCDVRDAAGTLTGRVVARGTQLPEGEYYLAVQIWIRNEADEYLIQQRAPHLTSPGIWATTAGYVTAGEASLSGAIREVEEELGLEISPDWMHLFQRLVMKIQIEDVWIADVSRESLGEPVVGSEVSAWKWASKAAIREMINQGEFFGYSYFESLA